MKFSYELESTLPHGQWSGDIIIMTMSIKQQTVTDFDATTYGLDDVAPHEVLFQNTQHLKLNKAAP